MLQKFTIYFSLVTLFLLTQMGAVAHEISHFSDLTQQHQQDRNTPNPHCAQCLSHANTANGLVSQPFILALPLAGLTIAAHVKIKYLATTLHFYHSRAPPLST